MKKDIREKLQNDILVADGGLGTLFVARGAPPDGPRSPLCLSATDLVREVHDDYVSSGASLLSTNTWDANRVKLAKYDWADSLEKINRTAVALAREAATGEYVYVGGQVGPLGQLVKPYGPLTTTQVREIFTEQIRILLEEGVDLLILETFSSTLEILQGIAAARELDREIPILASMTFLADGKTSFGEEAADSLASLVSAGADAVGMNCTIGPQETLEVFQKVAGSVAAPLSVMPNAGYPWLVNGRAVYPATPDYFRDLAREFAKGGAAVIGGCCGTGPEHVAAIAKAVSGIARRAAAPAPERAYTVEGGARPRGAEIETSPLKRKLADGRSFVVSAEIEPPRGTDASAAVDAARVLKAAGVDAVNITDNPMARLRMSSIAVAHLVKRETGVEPVFHVSPRDRNVLGIQSDLLGAAGLGIKAVLAVGGDPLKIGDYPQGKPVGEVDTLGLLRIVRCLNSGRDLAGGAIGSSTSFAIGCTANPAARDLDAELSRLLAKIEAGATFAQTQPVYDVSALDRFFAREESRLIPVLIGVIPPKSLKQALYFANEVPGMVVPDAVLERMRRAAEKGPEHEAEEGLAIAVELARAIAERARGLHVMPMGRYELVRRIVAALGISQSRRGTDFGGPPNPSEPLEAAV
jgi:methionine synthase I (cobalamin-dependent)/5,10-methylenetetrahydrofolate reductase